MGKFGLKVGEKGVLKTDTLFYSDGQAIIVRCGESVSIVRLLSDGTVVVEWQGATVVVDGSTVTGRNSD